MVPSSSFLRRKCKSERKSQMKSSSNCETPWLRLWTTVVLGRSWLYQSPNSQQPTASKRYTGTKNRSLKTKPRLQIMLHSFRSSRSPNSPKFPNRFSLIFLLCRKITKPKRRNLFIYFVFVLGGINLSSSDFYVYFPEIVGNLGSVGSWKFEALGIFRNMSLILRVSSIWTEKAIFLFLCVEWC